MAVTSRGTGGPLCRWLSASLVTTLYASAALAQTYTVNINPELHGLDVKIEPVATTGMLVVKLTNATAAKVRCDLRYDASPQLPYRKTTYVDPGKTEQSVFRAKQKWFTVNVNVDCRAIADRDG